MGMWNETVELAGSDPIDAAGGSPIPLVVAADDFVMRANRHAVGCTQAVRYSFCPGAVGGNSEHAALQWEVGVDPLTASNVIEIAFGIGLQIKGESVIALPGGRICIEAFVKICFTITIEIAKTKNPVTAGHINRISDDSQAECLEKARGETFPAQLFQGLIYPRHNPNIAAPGGNRGPTIGEEIESGKP